MTQVKDLHRLVVETLGHVVSYFTVYRCILTDSRQCFQSLVTERGRRMAAPGVFLFLNLLIAEIILMRFSALISDDLSRVIINIVAGFSKYVVGIVLFLFLVRACGKKLGARKLSSIFCYASAAYPPYAIVMKAINHLAGDFFQNFNILILSGGVTSIQKLMQPLVDVSPHAVPLLFILGGVLFWWIRLMYSGLGAVDATSSRTGRLRRLGLAVAGYALCKQMVLYVFLVIAMSSLLRDAMNYDRMKTAMIGDPPNYAEAYVLSERLTEARYLPPYAKYVASVIGALAQIRLLLPAESGLQKLEALIQRGKYREADLLLQRYIANKLESRKDPQRPMYRNVEANLKKGESFYNSPTYTEDPNYQRVWIFVPSETAPLRIFP